jgi:hypothetical protein
MCVSSFLWNKFIIDSRTKNASSKEIIIMAGEAKELIFCDTAVPIETVVELGKVIFIFLLYR